MAFNTNTPRVSYIATAGQTVFPFTFKIFTNTNLTVYKNSIALVLSTNYTVTINGDSGGEVTLLVGASLSDEIVIVRSLPITREFDYQDNGDFFADTVDNDQDYQTYLVQDVDAKFDRTFTLPDSISGTVISELPLPINDAYIRWNSDSTAIINDTEIPSAVLLAKDWANKAEDSVVADGEYSAKHYALKAEDEKLEATTQAGIATTKAGEASTSASQALGYRNEAEGFRDEAEASALSVDSANIVHKTGDETIAGVKTFTSSPIVPTPAFGDSSTKTATTAFIKTKGVEYNTFISLPSSYTATSSDIGKIIIVSNGSTNETLTLPSVASIPVGAVISIINVNTKGWYIKGSGAEQIFYGVSLANRIVLDAYNSFTCINRGDYWFVLGGAFSSLGVGQTWQDVTGSRVSGTTYTNSTGKPIQVYVNGTGADSPLVTVSGVQIALSTVNYFIPPTFIVPNGATYSVTVAISKWSELR